jgi:hypothetical protein
MPAVANAVYDAVGVRIDEIPVTPEKIMKALAERRPAATRVMDPRISRMWIGQRRFECLRRGKAEMATR